MPGKNESAKSTVERLIQSMLELVRNKGMEGANVRAITRGADVTEATLYRYFPDKQGMLHEVWKRETYAILDGTQAALENYEDQQPSQIIDKYVRANYDMYDRNPASYAYAVFSPSTRKWRAKDSRYQERKKELIEIFQYIGRSGTLGLLPCEMARRIYISTIHFVPRSIESGQMEGPAQGYASEIIAAANRIIGLPVAEA